MCLAICLRGKVAAASTAKGQGPKTEESRAAPAKQGVEQGAGAAKGRRPKKQRCCLQSKRWTPWRRPLMPTKELVEEPAPLKATCRRGKVAPASTAKGQRLKLVRPLPSKQKWRPRCQRWPEFSLFPAEIVTTTGRRRNSNYRM